MEVATKVKSKKTAGSTRKGGPDRGTGRPPETGICIDIINR